MRTLRVYRSYNFIDKDPIIDQLRILVEYEGMSYRTLADRSGVTVATLYAWFSGRTRRPQFATVMAVLYSLGYKVEVIEGVRRSNVVQFPRNVRIP